MGARAVQLRNLAVVLAACALATSALLPFVHLAEANTHAERAGAESPTKPEPLAPDHDAGSCEVCKQVAAARVAAPLAPLVFVRPRVFLRVVRAAEFSTPTVVPHYSQESRAPPAVFSF
jgi:hypothetical protein